MTTPSNRDQSISIRTYDNIPWPVVMKTFHCSSIDTGNKTKLKTNLAALKTEIDEYQKSRLHTTIHVPTNSKQVISYIQRVLEYNSRKAGRLINFTNTTSYIIKYQGVSDEYLGIFKFSNRQKLSTISRCEQPSSRYDNLPEPKMYARWSQWILRSRNELMFRNIANHQLLFYSYCHDAISYTIVISDRYICTISICLVSSYPEKQILESRLRYSLASEFNNTVNHKAFDNICLPVKTNSKLEIIQPLEKCLQIETSDEEEERSQLKSKKYGRHTTVTQVCNRKNLVIKAIIGAAANNDNLFESKPDFKQELLIEPVDSNINNDCRPHKKLKVATSTTKETFRQPWHLDLDVEEQSVKLENLDTVNEDRTCENLRLKPSTTMEVCRCPLHLELSKLIVAQTANEEKNSKLHQSITKQVCETFWHFDPLGKQYFKQLKNQDVAFEYGNKIKLEPARSNQVYGRRLALDPIERESFTTRRDPDKANEVDYVKIEQPMIKQASERYFPSGPIGTTSTHPRASGDRSFKKIKLNRLASKQTCKHWMPSKSLGRNKSPRSSSLPPCLGDIVHSFNGPISSLDHDAHGGSKLTSSNSEKNSGFARESGPADLQNHRGIKDGFLHSIEFGGLLLQNLAGSRTHLTSCDHTIESRNANKRASEQKLAAPSIGTHTISEPLNTPRPALVLEILDIAAGFRNLSSSVEPNPSSRSTSSVCKFSHADCEDSSLHHCSIRKQPHFQHVHRLPEGYAGSSSEIYFSAVNMFDDNTSHRRLSHQTKLPNTKPSLRKIGNLPFQFRKSLLQNTAEGGKNKDGCRKRKILTAVGTQTLAHMEKASSDRSLFCEDSFLEDFHRLVKVSNSSLDTQRSSTTFHSALTQTSSLHLGCNFSSSNCGSSSSTSKSVQPSHSNSNTGSRHRIFGIGFHSSRPLAPNKRLFYYKSSNGPNRRLHPPNSSNSLGLDQDVHAAASPQTRSVQSTSHLAPNTTVYSSCHSSSKGLHHPIPCKVDKSESEPSTRMSNEDSRREESDQPDENGGSSRKRKPSPPVEEIFKRARFSNDSSSSSNSGLSEERDVSVERDNEARDAGDAGTSRSGAGDSLQQQGNNEEGDGSAENLQDDEAPQDG